MILIFVFTVTLPSISLEDATEYYFFLSNRYKDTYRYTGNRLEIKAKPETYQERPPYIFRNKLLFLYYGYVIRLKETFSPQYRLSFDIYPEEFFKKLYPLEGKIISFGIDLLRSSRRVYALEYELDLSRHNRCATRFTLKSDDGKLIDITDKRFKKEFFMLRNHVMHFDIISNRGDIALYINDQLISVGKSEDKVEGVYSLRKYQGSQFQMDNLKITDLRTGEEIIKEDFDKYTNFFDLKEWFYPHTSIFFIIMLFALAALGYAFDMCLIFLSRLFGSELLWMKFIISQVLALLAINRFCSLSIEPGVCVVFSIVAAKIIYIWIHFSKINTHAE